MSLDEALFGRLHRWLRRRRHDPQRDERRVALDGQRKRFAILASMLAGRPIEARPTADHGGIGQDCLFLPAAIDWAPTRTDNLDAYVLRVALGVAALQEPPVTEPQARAAAVLARLTRQWPAAQPLFARMASLRAQTWRPQPREPFDLLFWGDLIANDTARTAPLADAATTVPESRDALPSGTERPAPPRRDVERVELADEEDQSPLCHVLEKVKTAEEHQGGRRELDGSDELAEHADALEELDLRQVLRSRAPTASVYRADLMLEGAAVELRDEDGAGEAIPYDEWDDAARRYRKGWCSVFVGTPPPVDQARAAEAVRAVRGRHAREIRALRAEFERLERARALRHRQIQGTDFDLDAVVDRHAALCAARRHGGRVDDERLYTARRPASHDLATLILLDASLSTDSWVENRRVLDVARESVIVLGEVLRDVRLRVGVAAFFSNARRDCRFQIVKGFDEDWPVGYRRLFGVRPTGYTRIGPAVRHATSLLRTSGRRRRLLLLISDGKPTDYDRYEGRYGIADVRQALREARQDGVRTVALTVDARAKDHLPRMFGDGGFRILRHPRDLPPALARLHERVLR